MRASLRVYYEDPEGAGRCFAESKRKFFPRLRAQRILRRGLVLQKRVFVSPNQVYGVYLKT